MQDGMYQYCNNQYHLCNYGATGATVTGLPAGVTGTWLANVVTISGTPTAAGPFTYTVTLTGGCGVITTTGTITSLLNNTVNLTQQRAPMLKPDVSIRQ